MEDYEHAVRYHSEALDISSREGYRQEETTSLLALGRIYSRLDENTRAIELLQRAAEVATDLGLNPQIAKIHQALAEVYTRQLAPALQQVLAWEKTKSDLAVESVALRYKL